MAKGFDLDYWLAHGYKPEDIFDLETGQPKNGWKRGGTAEGGGYVNPSWPDGYDFEPIPPTGDHGPGTTLDLPTFDPGSFDWPSYTAPDWISTPEFDPGPAFTYADFNAPNPSDINKDPAYQFRFDQGVKALGSNRAGKGTFLSGETGKALQDFGQKAASQEYDNIWNRALTSYDTNRNNAFQNWAAQYGQRKDKYGFLADENARHNSFNQSNAQFDFTGKNSQAMARFQDLFNRYKAQGDWLSALSQDPG